MSQNHLKTSIFGSTVHGSSSNYPQSITLKSQSKVPKSLGHSTCRNSELGPRAPKSQLVLQTIPARLTRARTTAKAHSCELLLLFFTSFPSFFGWALSFRCGVCKLHRTSKQQLCALFLIFFDFLFVLEVVVVVVTSSCFYFWGTS